MPSLSPATPPPQRSRTTPPVLAFAAYLLIVFAGAAIIAPRLYSTAQFLEREINWRFHWIASQPFTFFLTRSLAVVALLGLPSLFKALEIRHPRTLGLKPGARHLAEGAQGLFWGFLPVLLITALLLARSAAVPDLDHHAYRWLKHFRTAALTALLASLIQEILFRGAFFTALRRRQPIWTAALLSGLFFALLQLLGPPVNPAPIEWHSGFDVLRQMLRRYPDLPGLLPVLVNWTLLGALFALVFERTGALHFSVGMHAGLVFAISTVAFLTRRPGNVPSHFWGSEKLLDGWAATLILLMIFLLIERSYPPPVKEEEG